MSKGALVFHPDMIEGTRLFHASRFWDAHEAWERVWIVEKRGERGHFVQGLIQLAASLHKLLVMHVAPNARRLAIRANEKLSEYPDDYEGFALGDLRKQIDALIAAIARVERGEPFEEAAIPHIRGPREDAT
jgi:predicted metal-dependent hydrolase